MPSSSGRPFDIVPVLDIRHGQVVRARAGDREHYAPIVTPLSATADPVDVARGLLGLVSARHIYVADLDAIEGRGRDIESVRRLAATFPQVDLWIDAGIGTLEEAEKLLEPGHCSLVLGSESQVDSNLLKAMAGRAVLSLDFRGNQFMGPPALLNDSSLWPDRIIVMTLARVGTGLGPDLDRLAWVRALAPQAKVYAAGGLRGPDDIASLVDIGVSGVLVASALHDGRLDGRHLGSVAE
ncbi:hypothetical protein LMIY3S_02113 [Labrys miyagiensis]